MSEIEVAVVKGGREIERVWRPLRHTVEGPAVTYRRRLWRVNDNQINIDDTPLDKGILVASPGEVPTQDDDSGQDAVLAQPPAARVLVDAGPGTGKTFVACARVARLIREGIPPSRIWLVSFTRTAVVELRNRIADALEDPADAAAVRIATLDSHAWALQSGFSSEAALNGSFDQNITRTLERIQKDEDLREYLARIRHLVVDEGQDIVGLRAELTLAMIDALDEDCGVTVFADEAQAIYGFTEDADTPLGSGPSFLDRLRERGFKEISLLRVHRTGRQNLKTIFTDVRRRVLRRKGAVETRHLSIRNEIERLADEHAGRATELNLSGVADGTLVLMRRRVDVLATSNWQAAIPHRLRMSGLPSCLRPWIAQLLWDHLDRRLTKTQFDHLWKSRLAADVPASGSSETAWRLLVEAAGESASTIDLHRLRELLGRANPPMLFCSPEFGDRGPILGTIHASKGREADEVILYLPPENAHNGSGGDLEEEIRILFVGATRARQKFRVGISSGRGAGLADGRAWRWTGAGRVQIEVGRAHDLNAEGLVGRRSFAQAADALQAQKTLAAAPHQKGLSARAEPDLDWAFVLENADRQRLAVLAQCATSDVREIARQCDRWPPPGFLPHLRSIGFRTLVVRPDDPILSDLHEPWRTTGFMLAPLITGFSAAAFRGP